MFSFSAEQISLDKGVLCWSVARLHDIGKIWKGMGRTSSQNTHLEPIGRRRRLSGEVGAERGGSEYDSNYAMLVLKEIPRCACRVLVLGVFVVVV